MRRNDREITEPSEIINIIGKCGVCRLALSQNNMPYIIPLNFGYEYSGNQLTLYFHCAKTGRKLDIISRNPYGCFEMDCPYKLIEDESACNYSMEYESVIGDGKIFVCDDTAEKIKALRLIMQTYAPDRIFDFNGQQTDSVVILKLCVNQFTGKRNRTYHE